MIRVVVVVDYLCLCVASTYIIIGITMDREDDQSSRKDGALMIMLP
jgi:phage shock protein PspC (stress-responsive transcriptional regulator)